MSLDISSTGLFARSDLRRGFYRIFHRALNRNLNRIRECILDHHLFACQLIVRIELRRGLSCGISIGLFVAVSVRKDAIDSFPSQTEVIEFELQSAEQRLCIRICCMGLIGGSTRHSL